MKKGKAAKSKHVPVHRAVVVSDIHFPEHHERAWKATKAIIRTICPRLVVFNGDIIDLAQMSRFDSNEDQEPYVVNEIRYAIKEISEVALSAGGCVMVPGNHEDRYGKAVYGGRADRLKGLAGLSLREQFYAHGLPGKVTWISESKDCPGLVHEASRTVFRHGHRQGGRYGAVNIAAKLAREHPGANLVVGHHHRAQLHTQTVFNRTYTVVANPHLSGNHDYAASPDWQRGFTVASFYGHEDLWLCPRVSFQLVVADSDGGMVFDGRYY